MLAVARMVTSWERMDEAALILTNAKPEMYVIDDTKSVQTLVEAIDARPSNVPSATDTIQTVETVANERVDCATPVIWNACEDRTRTLTIS